MRTHQSPPTHDSRSPSQLSYFHPPAVPTVAPPPPTPLGPRGDDGLPPDAGKRGRKPTHHGATYDPEQDKDRLDRSVGWVYEVLRGPNGLGGLWWSVPDIRAFILRLSNGAAMYTESGISRRARQLRDPDWGGYRVDVVRSKEGSGLWLLRLNGKLHEEPLYHDGPPANYGLYVKYHLGESATDQ